MRKIMTVFLSVLIVISSITCLFTINVSAATNLWANISVDDWFTRQISTPVEKGQELTIEEQKLTDLLSDKFTYNADEGSFKIANAHGKHYYVKLPALETGKDYRLSVNYKITPGAEGTTPTIHKALLVPKSAFSSNVMWSTTGEFYAQRSFLGVTDIAVQKSLAAADYDSSISLDFNTKTQQEYYLFLMFKNVTDVTYSKFKVVDPKDAAEEEEEEDIADIWKSVSMDDWITRHVHTPADDGRNIETKTVKDNYPGDFSYDSESETFLLNNAHGRHYLVKMPAVDPNKEYTVSFDYSVVVGDGTAPTLYKVLLVPEAAFTSEYCWNKYGEIFADRTFIGISNVLIRQSLDASNSKGTVSYTFNSKTHKQYYLFIMFNDITTVSYNNFKLIDPSLYEPVVRPQVDLNMGSVSPAEIETAVGETVEFTATPMKGNVFEGWYDSKGTLLSTDLTLTYTVPTGFKPPRAVFAAGDVKVENASFEDSKIGLLAYYSKEKGFTKVINDENFDVEYQGTPAWEVNIQAHTGHVRTGNVAMKIQTQYAYSGRHFKGLEKNTDYAISFWAYIEKESGLSLNAFALPFGEKPYTLKDNGSAYRDLTAAETLGNAVRPASAASAWQEVVVNFNTGDNTDVTLWFISRGANSDRCWVDDFAVYKPTNLSVVADLGGSVSATQMGSLPKGSKVTVTATPAVGNTFKHWLDATGLPVSTDAEYTFTLDNDVSLKAVFSGYNKPARELFSLNGEDGTFEVGTIGGFKATDPEYGNSVGHCNWNVSTAEAYEGSKSLQVQSYYRNTVLPLTGLNENTDYKFSYYVKFPYTGKPDDWAQINAMAIIGINDIDFGTAEKVYTHANSYISGDSGWQKVELYFNTGEATAVNFVLRYAGEPSAVSKVYMDNITLYEYYSNNTLTNGEVKDSAAPWLGTATYSDGTLALQSTGDVAYQTLALGTAKRLKVSFRAKGNIFAGATYISDTLPSYKNTLSSIAYAEGSSTDWKEYSYDVYTGIHKGVNIAFASTDGTAYIDDVKVTEYISPIGGIIEKVDFETDRFALTHSDSNYEIYTATDKNDKNVLNGNKSLHFKHSDNLLSILDEAFLSYGVTINNTYRLTVNYKLDGDSAMHIAPSYPAVYFGGNYGEYFGEVGTEHSGNKWTKVQFTFTAIETGVLKVAIKNILDNTDCDFYVDDIIIEVAPDLVTDPKTDKSYCSDFYNVIKNGSFEEVINSTNWQGLPDSARLITSKDADSGEHYLTLTAGTKYVMPLDLNASEIYYFGASVRTSKGGAGKVSVVSIHDPEMLYYVDSEDAPASLIMANNSDWKHEGFGFRVNSTGKSYLVIECTKGTMDVDSVSLCLEKFTFTENPNRYYEVIPFDYDNIDPSLLVYNGGFDQNGNIPGDDGENSPATGDKAVPTLAIIITLAVATALLVLSKKKGGNEYVK